MFLVISVSCLRLKTLREKELYLLNPFYRECNREKPLKPDQGFLVWPLLILRLQAVPEARV